jgi:ABC-type transport system involved in cytochrome bd biosynthesis fused ATPase/permease subunit
VILITHGRGWAGRADRNVTLDQGRLVLAAGCFGTVPGGRALAAST